MYGLLTEKGILREGGAIGWNHIDSQKSLSSVIEDSSLNVYSKALEDLLNKKRREAEGVIESLDSHNFSVMVILGLLTNPSDAKLDNFIAKTKKKGKQSKSSAPRRKLVSIDNEDSFIYSVLSLSTGHLIGVRNILFCFPQMHMDIDARARDWLAQARPEIVIRDWSVEFSYTHGTNC